MDELYFLDGTQFSNGFERVVHGGRGYFVELTKQQIIIKLVPKFNIILPEQVSDEPFYYY